MIPLLSKFSSYLVLIFNFNFNLRIFVNFVNFIIYLIFINIEISYRLKIAPLEKLKKKMLFSGGVYREVYGIIITTYL